MNGDGRPEGGDQQRKDDQQKQQRDQQSETTAEKDARHTPTANHVDRSKLRSETAAQRPETAQAKNDTGEQRGAAHGTGQKVPSANHVARPELRQGAAPVGDRTDPAASKDKGAQHSLRPSEGRPSKDVHVSPAFREYLAALHKKAAGNPPEKGVIIRDAVKALGRDQMGRGVDGRDIPTANHVDRPPLGAETAAQRRENAPPLDKAEIYQPERNVPKGRVDKVGPGERYRLAGLDIGSPGIDKPGIKEGLQPPVDFLLGIRDKGGTAEMTITGLESKSKVSGTDPNLGQNRAETVKQYFVDQGVPADWIHTESHGSEGAPPSDASPDAKANWRGADINIIVSDVKNSVDAPSGEEALRSWADRNGPQPAEGNLVTKELLKEVWPEGVELLQAYGEHLAEEHGLEWAKHKLAGSALEGLVEKAEGAALFKLTLEVFEAYVKFATAAVHQPHREGDQDSRFNTWAKYFVEALTQVTDANGAKVADAIRRTPPSDTIELLQKLPKPEGSVADVERQRQESELDARYRAVARMDAVRAVDQLGVERVRELVQRLPKSEILELLTRKLVTR